MITGFAGAVNALINLDGTCPSVAEIEDPSFSFARNIFVSEIKGSFVLPAGAVLCGPRRESSSDYSYNISGYVPYE